MDETKTETSVLGKHYLSECMTRTAMLVEQLEEHRLDLWWSPKSGDVYVLSHWRGEVWVLQVQKLPEKILSYPKFIDIEEADKLLDDAEKGYWSEHVEGGIHVPKYIYFAEEIPKLPETLMLEYIPDPKYNSPARVANRYRGWRMNHTFFYAKLKYGVAPHARPRPQSAVSDAAVATSP